MKENAIALEISHKFIKVLFGYVLGKQVIVSYVKKIPINHAVENGVIKDRNLIIRELSKNNPIVDNTYHINQLINNAILVLPPYGLEVYQTKQITSVISSEKIVGELDVKNIYSIIRNKKLPVDNELIDIIPDAFALDNGEKYAVPPIGKGSSAITAYAKVHTLPKRINLDHSDLFKSSNIKIARRVVAPFAATELLATYPDTPNNYFLLDIGANSTSLSLVGNHQLFATRCFPWGGDNITDAIVRNFNISEAEAEKIKILFGLDKRKMRFDYTVCESNSLDDPKVHTVEALNEIIEDELDEFAKQVNVYMEQLSNSYHIDNYASLPIVVIGGGSKLKGLKQFLSENVPNKEIQIFKVKNIGARDPSLVNILGAIMINEKYPLTKGEAQPTNPINVSREE